MTQPLFSLLGRPSVSLDELQKVASLQTRVDRKYLVPESAARLLVAFLREDVAVLRIDGEQLFRYESLYFDTPDLLSYTLAARRRPRRFKVRIRTYENPGLCMLEVKCKNGRSATVKHRTDHPFHARDRLTESAGRFVDTTTGRPLSGNLVPSLTTGFWRTTLLDRSDGSRATIDQDISWRAEAGMETSLPGRVVLETKTLGPASDVDRWLWRHGHRPTKISKYCIGMALHDPTLPAHKWNRLLRSTFGWTPDRSSSADGSADREELRPLDLPVLASGPDSGLRVYERRSS